MEEIKMATIPKANIKTRKDLTKLIDELSLKKGVEIGVNEGAFSEWLLANSSLEILHSIDAWSTDTSKTLSAFKRWAIKHGEVEKAEIKAREVLAKFGARSNVIKSISWEAAAQFPDNSLDFVYFDGCHRFTGFCLDMFAWYPKVKLGGLIAGDDYWRVHRYEVMDVVNAFLFEHGLILHLTTEDLNSRGQNHYAASWWSIKEELTKKEFFAAIPQALQQLKIDKARLCEKGVGIVLPYQYYNAVKEELPEGEG